jgi:hypothetical protein
LKFGEITVNERPTNHGLNRLSHSGRKSRNWPTGLKRMTQCPATEFYHRFGLSEVDVLSPHCAVARLPAVQALPRRNVRAELKRLFKSGSSNFNRSLLNICGPVQPVRSHNIFIAFLGLTLSEISIQPQFPPHKLSSVVARSSSG